MPKWEKLGLVYCASGETDWAQSHAYVPTTIMLDEKRIRVYVAFLDQHQIGRVGYVDVEAANPLRVLQVSPSAVLDVGEPGTFDDHGVTPVWLLRNHRKIYLFYVGWQLSLCGRYTLLLGRVVSEDGGETFKRCSRVPLLERSDAELYIRSAASLLVENATWKLWYVAGDRWIKKRKKEVPTYNIRYLESTDGVAWGTRGRVCIETVGPDEFGFGRPFVIKDDGLYKMWYSIRTMTKDYRLGYAESKDGISWTRLDEEVGIDVSKTGWDSEMVCFPCIQRTLYGTYLFYNGNNYGKTGFGVARLVEE